MSAIATTKRECVVCGDDVQSVLSGEVMCNECITFHATAGLKLCPMCDLDIPKERDLCDLCIEALKKKGEAYESRKRSVLKVFNIHITRYARPEPNTPTWNQTLVVLSTDEDTALIEVFEEMEYDWKANLDQWSWDIKEEEGPFVSGFVLSDSGAR